MDEVRRAVIRLAESIQIVAMIVTTLAGSLTGMAYGRMIAFASGSQDSGAALIGFLVGGGLAFVLAATAAAILFTLSETASNTARIAELLRDRESSNAYPSPPLSLSPRPNPHSAPGARIEVPGGIVSDLLTLENWKGTDGELLFPTCKTVLKQAMDLGYTITLQSNNKIALQSPNGGVSYCASNESILRAGRYITRN